MYTVNNIYIYVCILLIVFATTFLNVFLMLCFIQQDGEQASGVFQTSTFRKACHTNGQ